MYACMHPLFRVNDYNHGVFRHRRALSPFPLWNPESRMVKGHFSRYSRHPGIRISIWIIKTINLSRIPRREFLQWCDASWSIALIIVHASTQRYSKVPGRFAFSELPESAWNFLPGRFSETSRAEPWRYLLFGVRSFFPSPVDDNMRTQKLEGLWCLLTWRYEILG